MMFDVLDEEEEKSPLVVLSSLPSGEQNLVLSTEEEDFSLNGKLEQITPSVQFYSHKDYHT